MLLFRQKITQCAGQGRSTFALSESHFPRGIRSITFDQNASQQSSSNFDIVLCGGNNARLISRPVPPQDFIMRHISSSITCGGNSSRLIQRPVPTLKVLARITYHRILPLGKTAHALSYIQFPPLRFYQASHSLRSSRVPTSGSTPQAWPIA